MQKIKFDIQKFANVNARDTHVVNHEVYISGNRVLGIASEITLPNIEYMTATIKGAGIGGEIDMPSRAMFANMETTIKWLTVNESAFKFIQHNALNFAYYIAQQRYDSGLGTYTVIQNKVEIQAVPKNLNLGKSAPSELMDAETVCSIISLKETYNNVEKLYIDKMNYVCRVEGKDLATDLKKALGII